jgi:predicted AlkP superfamily phosphohydrolase/phosphomutase
MRTIIVGFDSFDPVRFEALENAGKMPNLGKFVSQGGYSRLEVASPPQTEVSWTSIATGVDPGSHGIFDFVHRDPLTYLPYVSILPTKQNILGEQFLPPTTTRTLFQEAADMGFPATALWWPATFPARPEIPVATLPGLGTPDIRGQLGVGTFLSTEPEEKKKVKVIRLEGAGRDRFVAALEGPQLKTKDGLRPASLPIAVEIQDETAAVLTIADQKYQLSLGVWSPIIELKFQAGFALSVHAVTRVILTRIKDRLNLYFLPLQIHPLHPLWRYSTPASLVKDSWKSSGAFLTLGWPQDTNALEDGILSDAQFLDLCDGIFLSRRKIFLRQLDNFHEGVLGGIFDCLDRVQHMFLRSNSDIVEHWYMKLDEYVGEVQSRLDQLGLEKYRLLVLSDHGFGPFEFKIHLNDWLLENGYMTVSKQIEKGDLRDVEWNKTRAYALGLNSLYLNLAGREGQGIVQKDGIECLLDEIKTKLLGWITQAGTPVISRVLLKHEAFSGPYTRFGPDLVVGYAPGFRASSETGLGKFGARTIEINTDHWGGDHCIDSTKVPAVLFTNRDLRNMPGLSFRDIPFLALGKHLDPSFIKPPSQAGPGGQKDLEERLKGLGYL